MKWTLVLLGAISLYDHVNTKAVEFSSENNITETTPEARNVEGEEVTPAAADSQRSTNTTAQGKKNAGDVIIKLDLKTTTFEPNARRYGEQKYVKTHEKHVLNSILNPQLVSYGNDAPSMKLDLNLQSFLNLVNGLLTSKGLNTYADTIARKAADVYTTFRKHTKKEIFKPQVVEFRSGKPSLVYAFDAADILKSIDNFLTSALVRTYTDQLARKAGAVLRAANS